MVIFLNKLQKKNPDAFVLCVEKSFFQSSFKNNSEIVSLLEPSSWISTLKKNKITHLVMAGKIDRISTKILP